MCDCGCGCGGEGGGNGGVLYVWDLVLNMDVVIDNPICNSNVICFDDLLHSVLFYVGGRNYMLTYRRCMFGIRLGSRGRRFASQEDCCMSDSTSHRTDSA